MAKQNLDTIDEKEYPYINKGLEGIVAFSTTKSFIDGQKGELIYAGYNIDTLWQKMQRLKKSVSCYGTIGCQKRMSLRS